MISDDFGVLLKSIVAFSSDLAKALEEISRGRHNDANCSQFGKSFRRQYKKDLSNCEFATSPRNITALINRVTKINEDKRNEDVEEESDNESKTKEDKNEKLLKAYELKSQTLQKLLDGANSINEVKEAIELEIHVGKL